MSYPTFAEYEILYARYRKGRPIEELIDLAGDLTGRNVMDICCGNGEIGLECYKRGASVVGLVDRELDMLPQSAVLPEGVQAIKCDVENLTLKDVDVVICRQGVNYWMDATTADSMAKLISRGGVLIFNTFNTKPPREMTVKQYTYKKNKYVEVNYLKGDMVYHTQICDSYDLATNVHSTQFRWISPKQFEDYLSPYFHVERIRNITDEEGYEVASKTDIYKCVRNSIEYKEPEK